MQKREQPNYAKKGIGLTVLARVTLPNEPYFRDSNAGGQSVVFYNPNLNLIQ
jgi:hypothetical protein